MWFMRTRARQSVVAAAIGATFLIGGVANASVLIPGPDGVIHGCYRQDGKLRVINANQTCAHNETALPWNQQGPKGDPGPAHVVVRNGGSTVANGAAGSATADCQPGEIATGGGVQIASGVLIGNGGAGGAGGNGGLLGTGGAAGPAWVTGSAPNVTQGSATGWTGTVVNLSGSDQPVSVWALCAS